MRQAIVLGPYYRWFVMVWFAGIITATIFRLLFEELFGQLSGLPALILDFYLLFAAARHTLERFEKQEQRHTTPRERWQLILTSSLLSLLIPAIFFLIFLGTIAIYTIGWVSPAIYLGMISELWETSRLHTNLQRPNAWITLSILLVFIQLVALGVIYRGYSPRREISAFEKT